MIHLTPRRWQVAFVYKSLLMRVAGPHPLSDTKTSRLPPHPLSDSLCFHGNLPREAFAFPNLEITPSRIYSESILLSKWIVIRVITATFDTPFQQSSIRAVHYFVSYWVQCQVLPSWGEIFKIWGLYCPAEAVSLSLRFCSQFWLHMRNFTICP